MKGPIRYSKCKVILGELLLFDIHFIVSRQYKNSKVESQKYFQIKKINLRPQEGKQWVPVPLH
jgi:hypothetical protein